MRLFKRKPKPLGTIHIGAYAILHPNDLPQDKLEIAKQIAKRLDFYQGKICECASNCDVARYGDMAMIYGAKKLEQMSAEWDIDADIIIIHAIGFRTFHWKGTREQFMGKSFSLLMEST